MKICVVYDSVYGNTAKVAGEIGAQIAEAMAAAPAVDVPVLPVGEVKAGDLTDLDLLIIGSPTHGAMPTDAIQELLSRIGPPSRVTARAAAFDTRLTWGFLKRYGFAADRMADSLSQKGWTLAEPPDGFFVGGLRKGRLKRGELERAAAWARGIVGGLG